jgi:hypothetical protein
MEHSALRRISSRQLGVETKFENGSAGLRGRNGNRRAVRVRDLPDDRQAESGAWPPARIAAAVEPVEGK